MLKIAAKKSKCIRKKFDKEKVLVPTLGFEPGNLEILGLQQMKRNRRGVRLAFIQIISSSDITIRVAVLLGMIVYCNELIIYWSVGWFNWKKK